MSSFIKAKFCHLLLLFKKHKISDWCSMLIGGLVFVIGSVLGTVTWRTGSSCMFIVLDYTSAIIGLFWFGFKGLEMFTVLNEDVIKFISEHYNHIEATAYKYAYVNECFVSSPECSDTPETHQVALSKPDAPLQTQSTETPSAGELVEKRTLASVSHATPITSDPSEKCDEIVIEEDSKSDGCYIQMQTNQNEELSPDDIIYTKNIEKQSCVKVAPKIQLATFSKEPEVQHLVPRVEVKYIEQESINKSSQRTTCPIHQHINSLTDSSYGSKYFLSPELDLHSKSTFASPELEAFYDALNQRSNKSSTMKDMACRHSTKLRNDKSCNRHSVNLDNRPNSFENRDMLTPKDHRLSLNLENRLNSFEKKEMFTPLHTLPIRKVDLTSEYATPKWHMPIKVSPSVSPPAIPPRTASNSSIKRKSLPPIPAPRRLRSHSDDSPTDSNKSSPRTPPFRQTAVVPPRISQPSPKKESNPPVLPRCSSATFVRRLSIPPPIPPRKFPRGAISHLRSPGVPRRNSFI